MRTAAAWILLVTLAAQSAAGATLDVPADWPTIQAAMDAATAGDTVLVAPGTYTDRETRNYNMGAGPLPLTACVFLTSGVVLASSEGPEVTVINFGAQTGVTDDAILAGGLLPEGVTIRGFTLTTPPFGHAVQGLFLVGSQAIVENCHFIELKSGPQAGAGIRCGGGSLTLRDCAFWDCTAQGGAALSVGGGSVDAEGCLFESCSGSGGAVYIIASGAQVDVRLVNNVFRGNLSTTLGGAAFVGVQMNGNTVIAGNLFEANQAVNAGALWAGSTTSTTAVRSNLFLRNTATESAGATICIIHGSDTEFQGNTFVDNVLPGRPFDYAVSFSSASFSNNLATGTVGGGAFWSLTGTAVNDGCNVFWNNDGPNLDGLPAQPTDVEADPEFCDPGADDYRVHATSPCLAENSPAGCGVIGNRELGCGTVSIESRTWGQTKTLYR